MLYIRICIVYLLSVCSKNFIHICRVLSLFSLFFILHIFLDEIIVLGHFV